MRRRHQAMETGGASTQQAMKRLARAIELFRALDNTIPSQVISVYLETAASRDGIETRLLPERVGLTQASVSRALLCLSETNWHDTSKPGLNLVVRRVSGKDARQRVVELSPKGRKLARKLQAVLAEPEHTPAYDLSPELGPARSGNLRLLGCGERCRTRTLSS